LPQRLLEDEKQLLPLEGLRQVIGRSFLHRDHRLRDGAVGGHEDDGRLRPQLLEALEKCQPVHARHLLIGQEQIELAPAQDFQGLASSRGRLHPVARPLQDPGEHLPLMNLVVDDEQARRLRRVPAAAHETVSASGARGRGKASRTLVPSPLRLRSVTRPP
jgi:hypothetical protein